MAPAAAPVLSIHEPPLVNLLGHTAGAMVFGIFLWLLLRDRGPRLPALAAGLALCWNVSSLLMLGLPRSGGWIESGIVVVSYASLSLLPAVLLHLFASGKLGWAVKAGYAASAAAIAMHASELTGDGEQTHRVALVLTSVVFAVLAIAASIHTLRSGAFRLVGAMGLFLLSLTFAHFDYPTVHDYWQLELLVHHASIPIALFVLLQDYRFVMADAFIRFLANIALAGGITWLAASAVKWAGWPGKTTWTPAEAALALLAFFISLLLFALSRQWAQTLLTRLVFRRPDLSVATERLHHARTANAGEYLELVRSEMQRYAMAEAQWVDRRPAAVRPALVQGASGVEMIVPVRVSPAEVRHIALGRRHGGRRYLSEDIDALAQLASCAESQIERIREDELRQLVSEAELRALHAQIHPHFLFNALNTLYGVIPREARGARQMVLNLADIFRYFLNSGQTSITLAEEMHIVQAYLEIEALRLGDKLSTEIHIDPAAGAVSIPVLTIQPLVENAVKHGVAACPEGGVIRVEAVAGKDGLSVSVSDSGPGFAPGVASMSPGAGVAIENVKKRLRLFYGEEPPLEISREGGWTVVRFRVPVERLEMAAK
ncbi:MAG: histidine kinase [Bryobacterales bacterium]|nr:histidine kinase [Bryobacterales bacterium]